MIVKNIVNDVKSKSLIKKVNDWTPRNLIEDYNFFVDFTKSIKDQVSGNSLQTTLSAGRYDYLGNSYGENEPVIEPGKGLLGYGSYENLLTWSEDISNAAWTKNNATITGTDTFTATAFAGRFYSFISTTEGVSYTFSITARIKTSRSSDTTYRILHTDSASGSSTDFDLSTTSTRYNFTVLGKVGGGAVYFGFRDMNLADWNDIEISDIQVTESAYPLPYVKTEGSTVTVPLNYADADEGAKFPIAAGSQLKTALYGTDGSDAQGRIVVKWRPMFDYDQGGDTGYIVVDDKDGDDRILKIYPTGTNAGKIGTIDGSAYLRTITATNWTSGTLYTIEINYGPYLTEGYKFNISVTDGVTTQISGKVVFDGSFDPTDFLNFFYDNPLPQYIESIKILKEPSW